MRNLKVVSLSSKKENPSFNEVYSLGIHAESIASTKEAYIELADKPKGTTVTLEVGRKVYDCSGPSWAHSSGWEELGTATYVLIH
jgi:hypothetical protein